MKATLVLFVIFCLGIVTGASGIIPAGLDIEGVKLVILYILLVLLGINLGADQHLVSYLRNVKPHILLVPLGVVLGSLLGAGIVAWLLFPDLRLQDGLAVGAGFGYYSLSSIIITQISGAELGAIALIANLLRELATILFTPLLSRHLGKISPVASGGATSMDVALPVILKYSGNAYAIVAIVNGVVLTILVPILVPLVLR
jgi:uncharacterized membrane protein YbjE (DUF340 family)